MGDAGLGEQYSLVENILNVTSTSEIYLIQEVQDERYELLFGDGFIGKKLENDAVITVNYIITDGTDGNGMGNGNSFSYSGQILNSSGGTIQLDTTPPITTIQSSQNGAEIESISSIKYFAPRIYASQYRAVTPRDYEAIIKTIYPDTESVAVVGGIMMALSGGLFALPGLIASVASALATVGAAIIGFLLSPAGLITLAVIAGIGAAVLGANAIRTAMAGGKEFREAHKKNNEKLKKMDAMGVSSGGKIKVDGKMVDVMEHGTDEQKAAYMDFKAERDRLDGIRDGMNDEIDKTKKEFFDNIRANEPPRGTERKLYWEEARVEWQEKKQGIRDKWEAKITGEAAPAAPKTDAKVDSKPSAKVSTSEGKDPEISGVKPPTTPGPVGNGEMLPRKQVR